MHPPAASTFADELVHRAHDHARARLDEEARPLPDEPDFIEETRQILRDVKPHKSADDFFAAHGF